MKPQNAFSLQQKFALSAESMLFSGCNLARKNDILHSWYAVYVCAISKDPEWEKCPQCKEF
jgi:hypothetical protein